MLVSITVSQRKIRLQVIGCEILLDSSKHSLLYKKRVIVFNQDSPRPSLPGLLFGLYHQREESTPPPAPRWGGGDRSGSRTGPAFPDLRGACGSLEGRADRAWVVGGAGRAGRAGPTLRKRGMGLAEGWGEEVE